MSVKVRDDVKLGRNADARRQLIVELVTQLGPVVTRKQVVSFIQATGRTRNDVSWLLNDRQYRASRGQYTLQPLLVETTTATEDLLQSDAVAV